MQLIYGKCIYICYIIYFFFLQLVSDSLAYCNINKTNERRKYSSMVVGKYVELCGCRGMLLVSTLQMVVSFIADSIWCVRNRIVYRDEW